MPTTAPAARPANLPRDLRRPAPRACAHRCTVDALRPGADGRLVAPHPFSSARAKAAGWPTALMPGDGAPGPRQARTVLGTVRVRALSPSWAAPSSPPLLRSAGHLASLPRAPRWRPIGREPCRCQIGTAGCVAERSRGGGTGAARSGGHERSHAPRRPDPAPRSIKTREHTRRPTVRNGPTSDSRPPHTARRADRPTSV